MHDEEFLELARKHCKSVLDETALFRKRELIAYSREIERRTLEQAAVHFANQMDGSDSRDDQINEVLWAVVRELRAMIKEKK